MRAIIKKEYDDKGKTQLPSNLKPLADKVLIEKALKNFRQF
jgi:hypothetical protein